MSKLVSYTGHIRCIWAILFSRWLAVLLQSKNVRYMEPTDSVIVFSGQREALK